jgi:micrococcal nuclease
MANTFKFIWCFLLSLSHCFALNTILKQQKNTFSAFVISITDGDTIKILVNNQTKTIRLGHVDCPEKTQPFSKNATALTKQLCYNKNVTISAFGKPDRNDRIIAEVFVNGINLNQLLIQNGLAWHFKKYSNNTQYANLEKAAQKNKIGLWSTGNAVPPWLFRKYKNKK